MKIEHRLDQQSVGGCVFPVLDPLTGKRSKVCGEATPILDEGGQPMAFCAEHRNFIEEFSKQKYRENVGKPKGQRFKGSKHFVATKVVSSLDKKQHEIV